MSKLVNVLFFAVVLAFVTVGVVAYVVVKRAFRRVDTLVSTVKVATSKGVDRVVALLNSAEGVIQGVRAQTGDLVASFTREVGNVVVRLERDVDGKFKAVRQQVADSVMHYVQAGHYQGTTLFARANELIHQIVAAGVTLPSFDAAHVRLGDAVPQAGSVRLAIKSLHHIEVQVHLTPAVDQAALSAAQAVQVKFPHAAWTEAEGLLKGIVALDPGDVATEGAFYVLTLAAQTFHVNAAGVLQATRTIGWSEPDIFLSAPQGKET